MKASEWVKKLMFRTIYWNCLFEVFRYQNGCLVKMLEWAILEVFFLVIVGMEMSRPEPQDSGLLYFYVLSFFFFLLLYF